MYLGLHNSTDLNKDYANLAKDKCKTKKLFSSYTPFSSWQRRRSLKKRFFSAGSQQSPLASQQSPEDLIQPAELLPHCKLQRFSWRTEDPRAKRTGQLLEQNNSALAQPRHHFPSAGTVGGSFWHLPQHAPSSLPLPSPHSHSFYDLLRTTGPHKASGAPQWEQRDWFKL